MDIDPLLKLQLTSSPSSRHTLVLALLRPTASMGLYRFQRAGTDQHNFKTNLSRLQPRLACPNRSIFKTWTLTKRYNVIFASSARMGFGRTLLTAIVSNLDTYVLIMGTTSELQCIES